MSIEQRVRDIFREQLGLPQAAIEDHQNRITLGMDSLDEIEVVMAIEDEFGIEIPDNDAEAWKDVGAVIGYIHARLARLA